MNNLELNNIESNIYQTHFTNMMPQRGFLVSAQSFIPIIDIDLTYENNFILKKIVEENITYFFIENGPMRINPYQKFFILEGKDNESLDYLNSCNFYEIQNYSLCSLNKSPSFVEHNFDKKIVHFEKEIKENKLIFKINSDIIKILEKNNILIFAHPDEINPTQNLKLYIDQSESIKKYNLEGFENVLSYIDNIFKKLHLSGKLYKTRNGLRIILNDKFRSLLNNNQKESILDIMSLFMMDKGFLSFYLNSEMPLKNYLARLTPKLKNYKYFDSSYEDIFKNLHSINLESIRLEKNVKPIKYDFQNVIYADNKNDEFINQSFEILKNMIFEYIKNDSFAVCSLIKSYSFNSENSVINKYIYYHDKWTKADLTDTTLI